MLVDSEYGVLSTLAALLNSRINRLHALFTKLSNPNFNLSQKYV